MYNFFVAYEVGKWEAKYFKYEIERVFEYTAPQIKQRFRKFDLAVVKNLKKIPSLFTYEATHNIAARIGWINTIQVTSNSVTIEHELDPNFPPIPISSLNELKTKLDIHPFELNRTHWAIKDADLLRVLFDAKLIKENKVRTFRVFLCHASDDKPKVEKLYKSLIKDGIDVWLDKEMLLPGHDWEMKIQQAIRNSDAIIVFLSVKSTTKEGFVQKEIKMALDIADEKPDGTIFVIPARLEDCEVPQRLKKLQWVDLFLDDGYRKLYLALQERATSIKARIVKRDFGLD